MIAHPWSRPAAGARTTGAPPATNASVAWSPPSRGGGPGTAPGRRKIRPPGELLGAERSHQVLQQCPRCRAAARRIGVGHPGQLDIPPVGSPPARTAARQQRRGTVALRGRAKRSRITRIQGEQSRSCCSADTPASRICTQIGVPSFWARPRGVSGGVASQSTWSGIVLPAVNNRRPAMPRARTVGAVWDNRARPRSPRR